MQKKSNSIERKKYLNKIKITRASIIATQITIVILFIILWYLIGIPVGVGVGSTI